MYRTLVILRHTFSESIRQPIYSLLLALGSAIVLIFGMLPFFTLGEDTKMFKDVALDVIMLLVLIATLFATSKSIFEEIEDRTMLTLMSKPVRKWEVLIGKYLGIVSAALLAVLVMGAVLILCTYFRIPQDYQLRTTTVDPVQLKQIRDYRLMHIAGVFPALATIWLQICVLASIGVALSTRVSLVVNLPTVILIYIAGNLSRFLYPIPGDASALRKGLTYVISLVIPYLENFDLRLQTVYRSIKLASTEFATDPNGVTLSGIWQSVAASGVYGIMYVIFALAIGMWMFQNRELGGAEG